MSTEGETHTEDRTVELPRLSFGPFTFDPRRRELLRHGHSVSLSASQLRLLTLFIERRGELVTRDEIAARLWTDTRTIDVATGINTAVNRLRRNLQEAPGATAPIETVIGLGYRFKPVLDEVELAEDASEPEHLTAGSSEETPLPAPQHRVADVDVDPVGGSSLGELPTPDMNRLETRDTKRPSPPVRLPLARPKLWLVAAVTICLLLLFGAFGILVMRHSSTRAGTAPAQTDSLGANPQTLAPFLRVTADEDRGKLTAAAVSPSGQLVAYADPFGISVHSFTSSATRLLWTRPSFTVDRLSWFPDERGFLISGTDEGLHRHQVWFQPADSPYSRKFVEDADRATVSPDGAKMVFLRNASRELWQADAEGQHAHLLRTAAKGEAYDLVLWTPAGNRLLTTVRNVQPTAAQGREPETESGVASEFLDAETGSLLRRQEGFAPESGYLLRNGNFYFVKNSTPGPMSGMAIVMMTTLDFNSGQMLSAPHRVRDLDARRAESFSASLTGARTAAVLQRSVVNLFVADLRWPGPELSHVTQLSRDAKQTFPHSWTADAEAILVESDSATPAGEPPKWAIFRQPVDGSKATLLAMLPGNTAMAQLSPDSRWIMFLEFTAFPQRFVGLFRIPASGGRIEQVSTKGDVENFRCSASPAGRCVVREAVGNKEFVYYALDPLRGMGEELGRTAWQPRLLGDWGLSADGGTVAVVSHDTLHPHLSLFRLATSPAQVQEIAIPGHGTPLAATFAPDGKSLFVECQTETSFELLSLDLNGQMKLMRRSPVQIWAVPSRDGEKVAYPDLTVASSLWSTTSGT